MGEAELVARAADGMVCDVGERDPDDRRIDAAVVADLCLGRRGPVHPKGVQLAGATIDGPLDLAFATLAVPLRLDGCQIADGVDLTEATLPYFDLQSCRIGTGLQAAGARTSLFRVRDSSVDGPVVLRRSTLGNLTLDRTEIAGADQANFALDMWSVEVAGTVLLREARIAGALRANLGTISGSFAMDGSELTGADKAGYSIDIRAMSVGATLFFRRGFRCAGALRAVGVSTGGLELWDAAIGGVDAEGISFQGVHMQAGGSVVAGSGLVTAGAVHLHRARIEGDLALVGARIEGADGDATALHALGIHVGGSVRLNDLATAGAVRLSDGVVGGSLTLRGARIAGPVDRYGNSFAADGLQVGRSVHLTGGFTAEGEVRLVGATIGGQLAFEDAAPLPLLALRGARCAELADTAASWPPAGRLELRGFRFDALKRDAGWAPRLDWVRRQGFVNWSPEPYEQLAGYYSATGDEDAARRIRVAKNDDELTHLRTTRRWRSLGYRAWRRPLGWLVGYGYRRQRAAWLLAATLVFAGVLFRQAERDGAMVPDPPPTPPASTASAGAGTGSTTCGEAYPCFNSWVYGADVVLPIIDFGQDTAWRPVDTSGSGPVWIWARWAFIALGWALASVFVAAFTGLVQRS